MNLPQREKTLKGGVREQREGLFWMAVAVSSYASFAIFTKLIYARTDLLPLDVAVGAFCWRRRWSGCIYGCGAGCGGMCHCRRAASCSCWAPSIAWPRCSPSLG